MKQHSFFSFYQNKNAAERGMTLVEILAVIVLLSLIMGIVARGIFGKGEAAKANANVIQMKKVQSALSQYRLQFNGYPNSLQDLMKPSGDAAKKGVIFTPFVEADELKDVWGADYVYRSTSNGRSYELMSYGADGKSGGEGADQDVTLAP